MINKINFYIFSQIIKSCLLILFIFMSIAWLLQITRLFTLTNLIQIDILNIINLSFFLIPNLLSVILPFIIIFGILFCFIKLNNDKEIIAIFTLGLQLKPIKYSLIVFSTIVAILYIFLNFYISPKVYEIYKYKEFELRNTIDFNKMISTNFFKINKNTTLDFKKNDNSFEDVFINFIDTEENIIFAKKGNIRNENNNFIFQLTNGFKLSINDNINQIEKLEFKNYVLELSNDNDVKFSNYDRNSLTIFDDIKNKDYLNIAYKIFDILLCLMIVFIFYKNNIVNNNFSIKNNLYFIIFSILLLLINQLIKNSGIIFEQYLIILFSIIIFSLIISMYRKYE
ncbi:MAG: LptF/LptG family permease [Alphaproteobacteria bacterium]